MKKFDHKVICFEHRSKTLPDIFFSLTLRLYFQLTMVSDEILPWHRAKTKPNAVWREVLRFHRTWKLLWVCKYNHMLRCHANITLVEDVIEVGLGPAALTKYSYCLSDKVGNGPL